MRNIRNYSSKGGGLSSENPRWITGFIDGEGSFGVQCIRSSSNLLGWSLGLDFSIGLHKKDRIILEHLQSYFGVGDISDSGSNAVKFRVRSIQGSKVILKHFDKYPLITNKRYDYLLWRQALMIIDRKEHLTEEGLRRIVAIKAAMNLGLSDKLKEAFLDIVPVKRCLVTEGVPTKRPDPYWLAGFTSAEGCFFVNITKSKSELKQIIRLRFIISQHSRDAQLMKSLTEYFRCGSCLERTGGLAVDFSVDRFSDLTDKIIPFFKEYCILGVKSEDFKDFCRVADLMRENKHRNPEGIDQIRQIKVGMNKGRVIID